VAAHITTTVRPFRKDPDVLRNNQERFLYIFVDE